MYFGREVILNIVYFTFILKIAIEVYVVFIIVWMKCVKFEDFVSTWKFQYQEFHLFC